MVGLVLGMVGRLSSSQSALIRITSPIPELAIYRSPESALSSIPIAIPGKTQALFQEHPRPDSEKDAGIFLNTRSQTSDNPKC